MQFQMALPVRPLLYRLNILLIIPVCCGFAFRYVAVCSCKEVDVRKQHTMVFAGVNTRFTLGEKLSEL